MSVRHAADPAGIGEGDAPGARALVDALAALPQPRVLEVGTMRWEANRPTHHEAWAPHGDWLKTDVAPGPDVDVVLDAHTLRAPGHDAGPLLVAPGTFDAYVACSVWEHLERPWVAMVSAAATVRPGGWVYVQTHQTFPIHGYPSDYFRFSDKAMTVLAEDAGLTVQHVGYMYPCRIEPPPYVTRWNRAPDVEAYLNVELLARKP